jgi:hypothetical protein
MKVKGMFFGPPHFCGGIPSDETLPIINKPKHQEKGEYNEQNGKTHEKTKKTPKKVNRKGNIKILNPFLWQETYQIRKRADLLKGHPMALCDTSKFDYHLA